MRKYLYEARNLLALAIPVIIAQGTQTAIGVVDTIMAGGVSATDMAAVAVGTSIWLPVILFGYGLLSALTPIIAQLNGSGRRDKIAHKVQQSYWLALAVSILVMLVFYNSQQVISRMHNIDPKLLDISVRYLHTIMWGVPGFLFYQVLRNQCDGLSKTKPSMLIGCLALVVNVPINYIFIYGKFGLPALGGVGCGVAAAIVYWLMYFAMRYYVKHTASQHDITTSTKFEWPHLATLKRLTYLGLPVALALFFEVSLFAVVALLISPLGVVAVAGHQIALNFSGLMFVLPLSFGIAAAIRVGHCLGERSIEKARIAAYTSLAVGFSGSIYTALFTVIMREPIALLYNNNPAVITMATQLMFLAAIYQCSDSIQVVGSGILRGYKDTRSIFFITFIAYWVLGLPSGYILALTDLVVPAMGAKGFWIGFIIGLTASAIMMGSRIKWLQKQPDELILKRAER